MLEDELQAAIDRAEEKRRELQGQPNAIPPAKAIAFMSRAAELYRRQVAQGLDGNPHAALKARVFLREWFGGKIRLEPLPDGGLQAQFGRKRLFVKTTRLRGLTCCRSYCLLSECPKMQRFAIECAVCPAASRSGSRIDSGESALQAVPSAGEISSMGPQSTSRRITSTSRVVVPELTVRCSADPTGPIRTSGWRAAESSVALVLPLMEMMTSSCWIPADSAGPPASPPSPSIRRGRPASGPCRCD